MPTRLFSLMRPSPARPAATCMPRRLAPRGPVSLARALLAVLLSGLMPLGLFGPLVRLSQAQGPEVDHRAVLQRELQTELSAAPQEYRLAAGDVLRIAVYQNPDLSLEARLSEAGILNFPLIGPVRLGGLTVAAAERLIASGLREGQFVRQPQVNVSVMQVRGHQASVLGLVNRPGRFALEAAGLRLTELLAMAGGTAAGAADTAVVTGSRQGRPWRVEVDLPALFGPDGQTRDVTIAHGDTVWVDRQPQVYIYGEVQRPGPVRLERGMTLMQVLATGGGLTPRGTDKGIRLHRRGADGRLQVMQPAMEDAVRDGDVVQVRESLF